MQVDVGMLTLVIVLSMFVLLLAGLPFAFVSGAIACTVALILWGPDALGVMVNRVFDITTGWVYVAAPMFILMAQVLQKSGVTEDLFQTIYVWMGPLRGGLAITTITAGAIIAAMTGIIGTGIVTLGIIALPAMLARGYDKRIACGATMVAGGLGTLIPPSIVFIMYGASAGVSVGQLFIGGVMPGILLAVTYIAYVTVRSLVNPTLAPALPREEREAITWRQKFQSLRSVLLPIFLIVSVLGSIYGGFATPTEAAGVGCGGAFLCAAVKGRLKLGMVKDSLVSTVEVTGMMLWLAFGALGLVSVYIMAGGGKFVTNAVLGLPLDPIGTVIVMQMVLIILGMVLDWLGILFLTMPIFVPIVVSLGFDPVWFGVLFCMNMQIAYLSPPFGQGMFYLKGVAPPNIGMSDIIRSVWPFMAIQAICLLIVMLVPDIALWLPRTMIR